ncbi:DUF5977 domain-containing protein [uncultured Acetobacteroides sp.]|uniref:DUF5977 domain-containing protein n=1 Tax=uncultured Acetobacteroides sp. TaxID=1760811 RepID=UPI0029F4D478|nr:DUF5977 domain-containing protein [uncultured Acetobacteroides sp.]
MKSGKLEVPITLRYHIGNVKPGYDPSDVGFGWVLDVGGQISRTIYGKPDDVCPRPDVEKTSEQLDEDKIDDFLYLKKCFENTYDTEYDVFSYSFLSKYGTFIMSKNSCGNYKADLAPYKPIDFEFITEPDQYTTTKQRLATIKVKDENGDQYVFGNGAVETASSITSMSGYTSWMLKQITSVNKIDQIRFSYIKVPTVTIGSDQILDSYAVAMHSPEDYYVVDGYQDGLGNVKTKESYEMAFYGNIQRYEELIPKEISFNEGKVVFNINNTGDGTDGFIVYDNQGNIVKEIAFVKSNFGGARNHVRLDAVRLYDKNQTQYQLYQLFYNTTAIEGVGRDYWGYNNGEGSVVTERTYNYTSFDGIGPRTEGVNVVRGSATKAPNEIACQAEILNKIVYPTNGETEFIYEGNKYDHLEGFKTGSTGYENPAGGLRIKEIISRDSQGSVFKKSYQYEEGAIQHSPTDETNYKSVTFRVFDYGHNYSTGISVGIRYENSLVFENTTYSSYIFGDLGTNMVKYGKVTETFGDISKNDGKIIYYYEYDNSNEYGLYNLGVGSGVGCARKHISVKRDWNNGMLYNKETYKKNTNGSYVKIGSETNYYDHTYGNIYNNLVVYHLTTFPTKSELEPYEESTPSDLYKQWLWKVRTCKEKLEKTGNPTPRKYTIFGNYDYTIETGRTHLNQKRAVSYFDRQGVTDSLVTVENYYYDNPAHDQATRTETTTSRGNKLTTFTAYPLDYSSDSPLFVKEMQDNGLVTYPIESVSCISKGRNQYVTSGIVNQYKAGAKGLLDSQWMLTTSDPIALDRFKFSNRLSGVQPPTGSSTAFAPDSRYVRKVSYDSYDSNANLTAYHMEGDSPAEIVWGYKKQHPVAIAKGANGKLDDAIKQTLKYVGCNSLDTLTGSVPYVVNILNNPSMWDNFNRKLREMLPQAEVKTFTYQPLVGTTSETDSRGKTVRYAYDSFGRLMNVTELGKLVSNYDYKYYNQAASNGSFSSRSYSWACSKNTCPTGYVGGGVVYTVPEGKYTSTISQADADAKAQAEARDKGQAYANDNGTCYYLNTNTSSVAIAPNPGLNSTLTITSNTDWNIQGIPEWLSVSKTSGSGNATITMSPTVAYDSSQQRRATLTLQSTNVSISKTIEVYQ